MPKRRHLQKSVPDNLVFGNIFLSKKSYFYLLREKIDRLVGD